MAVLPDKNVLDGSKSPATKVSEMKTAMGQLRDFLAGVIGTAGTPVSARTQLGLGTIATENSPTVTDFTPVVEGGSTAGTGTYTAQIGKYITFVKERRFSIRLTWTAHTGTGDLLVKLPGLTVPLTPTPVTIGFVENLSMSAGYIPMAYIDTISGVAYIRVRQAQVGGTGNTAIAIDSAADIMISGSYFTA